MGECAHIIPKRVGSHPREDYKTSLEDRKKDKNLLYLCELHHKYADNVLLAADYPADLLKEWKANHEKWAANINKEEAHLPKEIQSEFLEVFSELKGKASNAAKHSKNLVLKLFEACRQNISLGKYIAAAAVLSQIELLLPELNSKELNVKAEIITGVLTYRNEDVHAAKKLLLNVIKQNPTNIEAMYDYVDICEAAPEPGDIAERYEAYIRDAEPSDPRIKVLEAIRAQENKDSAIIISKEKFAAIPDKRINYKYLIQRAILFDFCREYGARDALVNQIAKEYPRNPRPEMFRFVFKAVDTLRGTVSLEAHTECLRYSEAQKVKARSIGHLTVRDYLMWDFHELLVHCQRAFLYGVGEDVEPLADKVLEGILKSFPDRHILTILEDVLRHIRLPARQVNSLMDVLQKTKVKKPIELYRQMLIQSLRHPEIENEFVIFLEVEKQKEMLGLFTSIKNKDAKNALQILKKIQDEEFLIILLHHIPDQELVTNLATELEVSDNAKPGLQFAKVEALAKAGKQGEAILILNSMDFTNFPPSALERVEKIAWKQKARRLFIPAANKLLSFNIPTNYKAELNAKLAIALQKEGDDSLSVKHAEMALENNIELGIENSESMLLLIANGYLVLSKPELACQVFQKFSLPASFAIKLTHANAILKTSNPNKLEEAAQRVVEAFEASEHPDDRTYVSAFMALNEINQKANVSHSKVEDGYFVKLHELGWFYIGDRHKSLGATAIAQGTENYKALISKTVNEEIDWPSDKYSKPGNKRRIIFILSPVGFLTARAAEAMENLAQQGNDPIWSVQALKEDGSLDIETLTAFLKEHNKSSDDFFKSYCETPFPFSFLAAAEGSLGRAISKVTAEAKGFIRCNVGANDDLERQDNAAKSVLEGAACVIDGLSSIVLCEAGLMQSVLKAIPHLTVPVTVIKELRTLASGFDPATPTAGRGGYAGGRMHFSERNVDKEKILFNNLKLGADLLDALPNKKIAQHDPSTEDENKLPKKIPASMLDALNLAVAMNAKLLTDDGILPKAYELLEKKTPPQNFSSIALIKCFYEKNILSQQDYLKYFSLLSNYRYHLLPISVDGLMQTVMPTRNGLVSATPKNIEYLNLQLTLSEGYGVNKSLSLKIVTQFISNLIKDDTIPEDFADTVFAYTIVRSIGQKESKILAATLLNICKKQIEDRWQSNLARKKFEILKRQLAIFSETYDPMIASIPELMKVVRVKSEVVVDT